ncbi:MAG: hypothetical protein LBJ73_03065 [Rickettsiales bacterium]|jgi:hypothetical protein|nr:hypothetical protein [Rickettsiales bacterium]
MKWINNFLQNKSSNSSKSVGCALCSVNCYLCSALFALLVFGMANNATAAAVVKRGSVAATNAAAARPSSAATMPALLTKETETVTVAAPVAAEPVVEEVIAEIVEETVVIENKSSQFDKVLGSTGAGANASDMAADARAAAIRAQRAALDSADAASNANRQMESAMAGLNNACDAGLRDCMKQTCGNDYSKCAGDGDTIWGDKLDRCRRDLKCSGEEFQMFAREIKADRDLNSKMASYAETLNCGNRYNSCIVEKCGVSFNKCLGKSAGDKAVADCASIAKNCQTADSGLASRFMQVFGTLRQGAEVQAKKDEERLYQLRDLMAAQCKRLGAMFDERSLDCVFTVNFFADNAATPFASKKAYAGDSFDCTQNWFGVDITTYRENAYRLTREQSSASSAMLGAGLGTAAGAITSGAIDRAIDRSKAEKALKTAEKEHEADYGTTVPKENNNSSSTGSSGGLGDALKGLTGGGTNPLDLVAGSLSGGSQGENPQTSVTLTADQRAKMGQAVKAARSLPNNCDSESCKNLEQKIKYAEQLLNKS